MSAPTPPPPPPPPPSPSALPAGGDQAAPATGSNATSQLPVAEGSAAPVTRSREALLCLTEAQRMAGPLKLSEAEALVLYPNTAKPWTREHVEYLLWARYSVIPHRLVGLALGRSAQASRLYYMNCCRPSSDPNRKHADLIARYIGTATAGPTAALEVSTSRRARRRRRPASPAATMSGGRAAPAARTPRARAAPVDGPSRAHTAPVAGPSRARSAPAASIPRARAQRSATAPAPAPVTAGPVPYAGVPTVLRVRAAIMGVAEDEFMASGYLMDAVAGEKVDESRAEFLALSHRAY